MTGTTCLAKDGAETTPRWEWRTFGQSLAGLEAKIGPSAQVPAHYSEELYLVNPRSPHNAKIRDALLDVKRIKSTAPSGLELWEVALKHGFPLSSPTITSFFAALELGPPTLQRACYDLEEFLREIIDRDPAFRTVRVRKARRQFFFGGCRAELARLWFSGSLQETFCIEDESPERVEAALRELGLDAGANINFPKFFKQREA